MPRETKFRVWNGIEWCGTIKPGQEVDKNDYESYEDLVFLQFTGLLDTTGNEIYEGDIVKCFESFQKHGLFSPCFEIIFEYGKFRLKHIETGDTFIDFSPYNFINSLRSEELEIFVNIF